MQNALRDAITEALSRRLGAVSRPDDAQQVQPEPVSAQPIPPASDPVGRRAALVWGGCGFLVGAVFWHAIGFWGFVSAIVLNGPASEERVVAQSGLACVELVLDRSSGQTTTAECPFDTVILAEGRRAERQDFEGVRGWRPFVKAKDGYRVSVSRD